MTAQDTKTTRQVTIGCGADLVAALQAPEVATRLATLAAVADHPAKALQLAQDEQIDVFEMLHQLYRDAKVAAIRAATLNALLALNDDRGMQVAVDEFLVSQNTDILLLTAAKLAAMPEARRRRLLAPVVMEASHPLRSRAAANLLAFCRDLDNTLALRVALLSDHRAGCPKLNAETMEAWVDALQGPFPLRARQRLLDEDTEAVFVLIDRWQRLPTPVALWAAQQAVGHDARRCLAFLTPWIRQEGNAGLRLLSLNAAARLGAQLQDSELETLYHHADPELRAAAIAASSRVLPWAQWLACEGSDKVRAAIVSRLGRSGQADAPSQLACCMEDSSWRVRAAATQALIALGPEALPFVRRLLEDSSTEVRAAATQVMRQLAPNEVNSEQAAPESAQPAVSQAF